MTTPYVMVEPIYSFDEELEAFHEVVSKVDEDFFMYMCAGSWQEAKVKGRAFLEEMLINGEWMLLKDIVDD